jgi:hypothetical protein
MLYHREGLVDADVNVFVDSSRNKKAAGLFVIRRQIGSSVANRNTKRSSHEITESSWLNIQTKSRKTTRRSCSSSAD